MSGYFVTLRKCMGGDSRGFGVFAYVRKIWSGEGEVTHLLGFVSFG